MGTDVVEVKEQDKDLAAQLAETKGHVSHLALELSLLREQIRTTVSSRRGIEGARGERGDSGPAGKDAMIKIVQVDGKIQVIDGDVVKAELIAVPGPTGATGATGSTGSTGQTGPQGPAPDVDAIVAKVVAILEARLLKK